MFKRPLTAKQQRDLISRFTVPNGYLQGRPRSEGLNLVVTRFGMPGGVVRTTYSPDGTRGTNVTTPFHVFTGIVERSIENTTTGAYMVTHGYGGYPEMNLPPPNPFASMETMGTYMDLGDFLDSINAATGPEIFNSVDKQAALYARTHFPGC